MIWYESVTNTLAGDAYDIRRKVRRMISNEWVSVSMKRTKSCGGNCNLSGDKKREYMRARVLQRSFEPRNSIKTLKS